MAEELERAFEQRQGFNVALLAATLAAAVPEYVVARLLADPHKDEKGWHLRDETVLLRLPADDPFLAIFAQMDYFSAAMAEAITALMQKLLEGPPSALLGSLLRDGPHGFLRANLDADAWGLVSYRDFLKELFYLGMRQRIGESACPTGIGVMLDKGELVVVEAED